MEDLTLSEMHRAQRELQDKYRDKWEALCPAQGRSHLLWTIGEASGVGDIIKKQGDQRIMEDPEVRAHFIEELCDVYMYLASTAMCYDITPEDLTRTFWEKHQRNMGRW